MQTPAHHPHRAAAEPEIRRGKTKSLASAIKLSIETDLYCEAGGFAVRWTVGELWSFSAATIIGFRALHEHQQSKCRDEWCAERRA